MTTFAVGERVLQLPGGVNSDLQHYDGQHVCIVCGPYTHPDAPEHPSYQVKADDGRCYASWGIDLQKLPPPRDDLQVIAWDQCVWQPKQVSV